MYVLSSYVVSCSLTYYVFLKINFLIPNLSNSITLNELSRLQQAVMIKSGLQWAAMIIDDCWAICSFTWLCNSVVTTTDLMIIHILIWYTECVVWLNIVINIISYCRGESFGCISTFIILTLTTVTLLSLDYAICTISLSFEVAIIASPIRLCQIEFLHYLWFILYCYSFYCHPYLMVKLYSILLNLPRKSGLE